MKIHHEISRNNMVLKITTFNKVNGSFFHWHDKIEIVLCLKNSFEALIDGVKYTVEKGDLVIIDGKMIHNFSVIDDSPEVILGQFPYRILLNSGVIPVPVVPIIKAYEIDADIEFKKKLNNILEVMLSEPGVPRGEKNPFMECMFSALYFLLMARFPKNESSSATKKEKTDFYKIVEYVNENFKEDITVQSIAEKFYMNRTRVSKIFSKYSGITLNYYINTLRISEAVHLIENGSGITEAAFESGFQSIRTFNDVYKKLMKTSPREKK